MYFFYVIIIFLKKTISVGESDIFFTDVITK
jgi:hypothetical protein